MMDIEEVRAAHPAAIAALNHDGYTNADEMYERSDVVFAVVDGELRCGSHDERSAAAWRNGAWVDVPWDNWRHGG